MWNLLIGVKGLCNNPSVSLRLPAPFSREPKVKASLKGREPPLGSGGFCEIFYMMFQITLEKPRDYPHVRFPIHIAARCGIMLDYRMDTFCPL